MPKKPGISTPQSTEKPDMGAPKKRGTVILDSFKQKRIECPRSAAARAARLEFTKLEEHFVSQTAFQVQKQAFKKVPKNLGTPLHPATIFNFLTQLDGLY